MRMTESFSLALKNIASSKVRTLLTMLGIIIGVAAVIVIVGLGNGLENYIAGSFSSMGTNTLTISVQSRGATRTMEVEDMYRIVAEHPQELALCSPTVSMMSGVKIGSETTSTSASGVSEDYDNIYGYTIAQGRGLQYSDIATRAKVCVVGAYVNRARFGGNGGYTRVYPSRLAGAKLFKEDVRYYTLDADGKIDRMVLQEVTGDTQPYVYLSGIKDNSSEMNISVNYTYIQDGQTQTISGGAKYLVQSGGAMLVYEKGSLKRIRQLTPVNLDSLSALSAMGGGTEYKLAENVQVLLRDSTSGQGYYRTDLSQVNSEDYKLTGWYDDLGYSAGGRIRMLIAAPIS